ncbi:MAG TPA: hypothetical protein VF597_03375 [Candidatus Saccharimonadales bacterium]|jgi:hypothetical protein
MQHILLVSRQPFFVIVAFGTFLAILLSVFTVSSPVAALGYNFFDDEGTTKEDCDIWYPMTAMNDATTGDQMCTAGPQQDEPLLLWAGQTENVTLPEDRDVPGHSLTFVKARAYFSNLPTNANGTANPAALAYGASEVRVLGSNLCAGSTLTRYDRADSVNNGYYETNPAAYVAAGGTPVTRYQVGNMAKYGRLRSQNVYCTMPASPNRNNDTNDVLVFDLKDLPSNQIQKVRGIADMWYVDITVRHRDVSPPAGTYDLGSNIDGVQNTFKLTQNGTCNCLRGVSTAGTKARQGDVFDPAEGYVASVARGTNGYYPIENTQSQLPQDHATYVTRFGADCDVTYEGAINSAPRYRLVFYDIDFFENNWPSMARLRVFDETANMWLWPGGARNAAGYDSNTTIQGQAANNGEWRTGAPTYAQSIAIPFGDRQYFIQTFPAVRNHKYRMELLNVGDGRLTQYSVPFDSIYYQRNCDMQAGVNLTWDKGMVTAGDSATVTGTIQNTGVETARLQWSGKLWYDDDNRNEDSGDGAGESAVLVRIPGAGRASVNVPAGQTSTVLTRTQPNISGAYRYICGRIDAVNQTGDPTILSPASVTRCIRIASSPDLRVDGGDLRAGGAYPGAGLGCTTPLTVTATMTQYRIHGRFYDAGSTRGSYGQYGVLSPGMISGFGSNNRPYGSGPGVVDRMLLFGTRTSSNNGSATDYGRDGIFLGDVNSPTAQTHCLADAQGGYGRIASANTVAGAPPANNTPTGSYVVGGGTTTNICSGGCTVPLGQSRVIHVRKGSGAANAVVQLNGNVNYQAGYTVANTPLFVLLLDDGVELQVAGGVSSVRGIIAGHEVIRTCGGQGTANGLTNTSCAPVLTVLGATVTDGALIPYRTEPLGHADVFRLTPETLIGDYNRARSASGAITTVDQLELPPRF